MITGSRSNLSNVYFEGSRLTSHTPTFHQKSTSNLSTLQEQRGVELLPLLLLLLHKLQVTLLVFPGFYFVSFIFFFIIIFLVFLFLLVLE